MLCPRWLCRYGPQPRRRRLGCGWGGRGNPRRGFAAVAGDAGSRHAAPAAHAAPAQHAAARIPDELPGADLLCPPSKADLNASKSPGGVRSPLQLLFVPQAASCPELLLSRIVFLSRWGHGLPAARPPGLPPPPACWPRCRLQLAGGEATFVCQPVRPPPPARAISGNSS